MKEKMPLPILDRHIRLEVKANTNNDAKGGEYTPDASELMRWQLVHPQSRGKYLSPADASRCGVFGAFLSLVDVLL